MERGRSGMKKTAAVVLMLFLLVSSFQAFAEEPCAQHVWGKAVVTVKRSCTENGVKTRTCKVCGATKDEVYKAYGHRFGEWYIADNDKPGMLQRECEMCHEIQYRYCAPLNADDFPVAEVVANAARYADGRVTVLHEEELLTADELARLDVLSAHDRVLAVLCAVGFGEQVRQLQLGGDTFSEEAQALADEILARIGALEGADKAAYDQLLERYFPAQVISMDPTAADYQQAYLTLVFDGEETEEYGFSRNGGNWSFRKLKPQP